eukprot:m.246541 g.246541  ORF g.246541 m.246541 type:complete len:448 (+) comp15076_c0_seq1:484-1827(+)
MPARARIVLLCAALLVGAPLVCALDVTPAAPAATQDRCFRELVGMVEDCRCSVETVDTLNQHVYAKLEQLSHLDFFKYYKANLHTTCPFWPDDGECRSPACAVSTCSDDAVPSGLKFDQEAGRAYDCTEGTDLAFVRHTVNDQQLATLESWTSIDEQLNFCDIEDEGHNGEYVNLLDNPERYTGYVGSSPGRIWRAMYSENCFKPDNLDANAFLTASVVRGMCIEKRVFYRVVSGLHACINLHVAASYPVIPGVFPLRQTVWGPNATLFDLFFDPQRTFGEGPSRLRNMYFTYLLLLRAAVKGAPLWASGVLRSGDTAQDALALGLITELIAGTGECSSTFNETEMFQGDLADLKLEFSQRFKNVSRIMDCVGCEKCRMWGKVQIQGLGTAMKILFSGDQPVTNLRLRRNELVAFFATFARFSQGLHELDQFRQLKRLDEVRAGKKA